MFLYGKLIGNTQELSRTYLEPVSDLKSAPKSPFGVSKLDFSTCESGNTQGPTTLRTCEPTADQLPHNVCATCSACPSCLHVQHTSVILAIVDTARKESQMTL